VFIGFLFSTGKYQVSICKCGERLRDDSLICFSCGRKFTLDPHISGTDSYNKNLQSNNAIDFLDYVKQELSQGEVRLVPSDESMREVLAEFEQRKKDKNRAEKLRQENIRRDLQVDKKRKRKHGRSAFMSFRKKFTEFTSAVLVVAILVGILQIFNYFQSHNQVPLSQARMLNQNAHIKNPSVGSPARVMPLPDFDQSMFPNNRIYRDKPDKLQGFQLHAVYVVPRGANDHHLDTSGVLSRDLHQAKQLMDSQFGDHIQIDLTAKNKYDVTYLQSTYTYKQLTSRQSDKHSENGLDKLTAEYLRHKPDYKNRKLFVFLVDGGFRSESGIDYCGFAPISPHEIAVSALVLTGDSCSAVYNGANYVAQGIVHETIHALGVDHVKDPHDLMCGHPFKCASSSTLYADPKHQHYFFGSKLDGSDISNLRVWSKSLGNRKLKYPCGQISALEYECGLVSSQLMITNVCYKIDESVTISGETELEVGLNQKLLIADSGLDARGGGTCYGGIANINVKKSHTAALTLNSTDGQDGVKIHFRK